MRGDYSVGRILGESQQRSCAEGKTQQDLTTGGHWPRVSKIPAVDSILRPNPPLSGVRSCRAIQRSYLTDA